MKHDDVVQDARAPRPAVGTEAIKALSFPSEEYYQLLIKEDGIFARIRDKMAWLRESGVVLQHDGVVSYIEGARGNDFRRACAGFKVQLIKQPAQAPDVNKLDNCLFHSSDTQAMLTNGDASTTEALVAKVLQQFEQYDLAKLIQADALLHDAYRGILRHGRSTDRLQAPRFTCYHATIAWRGSYIRLYPDGID